MPKRVLIDAGPIIAFLSPAEEHHAWSGEQFKRFAPFDTCESVMAEVCARMAYYGLDQWRVVEMIEQGVLRMSFDLGVHACRVKRLIQKYGDQPMDLADACLVVMAEEHDDSVVVTLDQQDFSVYRRFGRDLVPFVAPGD